MDRQKFRVLFAALMATRHIRPHVPIGGEPVRRVARQRIPPLILVYIKVVRIGHWIDGRLARLEPLHERTAPTARVHPRRVVVADAPRDARPARLNAPQVTAHLAPEHISQRNHHRRTTVPNRKQFHATTDIQAVYRLRCDAMDEQAKLRVVYKDAIAIRFGADGGQIQRELLLCLLVALF